MTTDRDDLINLVRRIIAAEGTEAEIDAWLDELKSRVVHPTDLIDHSDTERSVEEIVDKALSYRPIPLGPAS